MCLSTPGISDHDNILTLLFEITGNELLYGAFIDIFKPCHIKCIQQQGLFFCFDMDALKN